MRVRGRDGLDSTLAGPGWADAANRSLACPMAQPARRQLVRKQFKEDARDIDFFLRLRLAIRSLGAVQDPAIFAVEDQGEIVLPGEPLDQVFKLGADSFDRPQADFEHGLFHGLAVQALNPLGALKDLPFIPLPLFRAQARPLAGVILLDPLELPLESLDLL